MAPHDIVSIITSIWEKFTHAWERGYNLEYLRKVKKRTTDPETKNLTNLSRGLIILEQNTSTSSFDIPLYERIMFHASPAVRVLYFWLITKAEPGTIQEFDKEDFDAYCIKMGRRKPYSIYWFTRCIKELAETPLLTIIRRYRGYGYKVRVYCPSESQETNNQPVI